MKKWASALLILAFAAAASRAEDGKTGWVMTGKAMASAAIGAVYAAPSVGLAWQPDFWGVGLEVRGLVNAVQPDLYLVPFLEGRIGWFFLGIGLDLPLVLPQPVSPSDLIPALTAGFDIPIVPIGPGRMGATVSADAILTLILASGSRSTLGDVLGSILLTLFGTVKATAGLHYSVPL